MAEDQVFGRGQEAASREGGDDSLPKWTQGPWKIIRGEYWDKVISTATYDTIAAIREPANQAASIINPAEELANAHLIAAAPELYESLHSLLEDPRFEVAIGGNPNAVEEMLAKGRAALAKARGERP